MTNQETIKKKAMENIVASEFKKNNGTVMRMVVLLFKNSWFKYDEIESAVAASHIKQEELYESLDYLTNRNYIEVRDTGTKLPVRLGDVENDTIEFKLAPEGKLVALYIRHDDGIEM